MDRFQGQAAEVPVVICGGQKLFFPAIRETASSRMSWEFNEGIEQQEIRAVIFVGAGRPGSSRRDTPRPRGFRALVVETTTNWRLGGFQFPKIENYLDFRTRISGQELAGRA